MPESEVKVIVPARSANYDPAERLIESGVPEDSPIVEAARAGMMFYKAPHRLTPREIDEKLYYAVKGINNSGWVWTGESCQGHPDSKGPHAWSTHPYLRLICRTRHFGAMMDHLFAVASEREGQVGWNPAFKVQLSKRSAGWTEIYLRIEAKTVFQRDEGCDLLADFADEIQYDPDAIS